MTPRGGRNTPSWQSLAEKLAYLLRNWLRNSSVPPPLVSGPRGHLDCSPASLPIAGGIFSHFPIFSGFFAGLASLSPGWAFPSHSTPALGCSGREGLVGHRPGGNLGRRKHRWGWDMEPETAYCHHCQVQPEPGKDLQGRSPWPALEGRVTSVCV